MIGPDSLPGLLFYEAAETSGRVGLIVGAGGGYVTVLLRDGHLAEFDPTGMTVHARSHAVHEWLKRHEETGT